MWTSASAMSGNTGSWIFAGQGDKTTMRFAVTGAFGYSGRYIAKRLLEAGHEVITLTNSAHRPNPFGEKVAAFPFHFEEPQKLRESLRGVDALVRRGCDVAR